jgi:hypothetical protein
LRKNGVRTITAHTASSATTTASTNRDRSRSSVQGDTLFDHAPCTTTTARTDGHATAPAATAADHHHIRIA